MIRKSPGARARAAAIRARKSRVADRRAATSGGFNGVSASTTGFRNTDIVSIISSFSGWSSGTKLARVTTRSTVSSRPIRAARIRAAARSGATTSMVYGAVRLSRMSSRNVRTDSVDGSFKLIGFESNRAPGTSARAPSPNTIAPADSHRPCRRTSDSATPALGACRGRGASGATVSSAGSTVRLANSAMNMPVPAITPSSDKPS